MSKEQKGSTQQAAAVQWLCCKRHWDPPGGGGGTGQDGPHVTLTPKCRMEATSSDCFCRALGSRLCVAHQAACVVLMTGGGGKPDWKPSNDSAKQDQATEKVLTQGQKYLPSREAVMENDPGQQSQAVVYNGSQYSFPLRTPPTARANRCPGAWQLAAHRPAGGQGGRGASAAHRPSGAGLSSSTKWDGIRIPPVLLPPLEGDYTENT